MFATTLVGTWRSAVLVCLIGITLAASEAKLGPLERLSKTELLISTGIGSVPEQLLPA